METEEERESQQALMLEPTRRCALVQHELLMARREAAAADAAVAAVAQVGLLFMQSAYHFARSQNLTGRVHID